MATKNNVCWTPTSLWKLFQEMKTGKYIIIVDNKCIKVVKNDK